MSLFPTSRKSEHARYAEFSLFGAHAFYMIKEIWNSIIYTKSARPLYTCSSQLIYFV